MPPIDHPVPGAKYDIVFIGGGSGGSAGSVCFTRLTHVLGTYYVIVTRSVVPRFMAQRPPS